MKKILFIIIVVLVSSQSFSQVLNVVKTNGETQPFNLSNIDDITFSAITDSSGQQPLPNKLIVHTQNQSIGMFISGIDSMYFSENGLITYFQTAGRVSEFNTSDIDSITFGSSTDSTVYITYNGTEASVINPLESLGVTVEIDGADVIVTANTDIGDLNYVLTGTTSDGMFKIYSDKKFDLHLNNVQITNNDGPAVNVQSSKKITVILDEGTNNILTDGETYSDPPDEEDQDGAFFSEGQLIFTGSGNLAINGLGEDQHGLCSDDYIEVEEGNITINSAVKDGIHVNDGFFMNGGRVDITSDGDGIDAGETVVEISDGSLVILNSGDDKSAIKADSTINITGGNLNITVEGDQSKGIKSKQTVTISNCTLDINTSGGVVLESSGSGFDPSYCTAIKADLDVIINSSDITITATGTAGRGISCDRNIIINSGSIGIASSGNGASYTNESGQRDTYAGHCLNADGSITIADGEVTLNNSGSGGKGINVDANLYIGTTSTEPIVQITTTGQKIYISTGDYAEAKAISVDNTIRIENGNITISSADDGIKSKDSLIINDGTINITKSYEGLETPNLTINGGDISVNSSDDGLNTTYGTDGEFNDGSRLIVNGGYIYVNSTQGDAIDGNGDIFINGGVIVANGPQSDPEVGLDVNGACKVTGGFLVISGTNSNMTEGPSQSSTQHSVLCRRNQALTAGTLFHIEDTAGNSLVTFAPIRNYYSIIFSDSQLTAGSQYKIYTGGSYSGGTIKDGLYTGGTYTSGTLRTTFTLTSMSQTVSF